MLRVDAVSCTLKKNPIVREVSFTVRPGEVLALLGANGAGKSTLLKMLCGERQPDSGQIHFYGKPLASYSVEAMAIKRAMLHQHNSVNMPFTVAEIILMGRYPHYRNQPAAQDHVAAEESAKICGVEHLLERNFLSLSGGEQQRVQLARVLCQVWDMQGALLLLDEPVAAMDALYQQQTLAIVRALARKGYMVIAALHEINLAAQYADRILMMKHGKRWCDGTPSQVLTPLNIYTVFSIEAEVVINPRTLNPYMIPKEIKLNATLFNTLLPVDEQALTLREQYELYKAAHPRQPAHETAAALGISEAELVMIGLGNDTVLLRPEMKAILEAAGELGYVKALTRNEDCIHERKGLYDQSICVQLQFEQWQIAIAVHDADNGRNSIEFFSASGTALHKIILTEQSNKNAYRSLVERFRDVSQKPVAIQAPSHQPASPVHNTDGHVLRELTVSDFKSLMALCSDNNIPLRVTAGNNGCVQQHTGTVKNLVDMGAWYHVNDAAFTLHLREAAVKSARYVVQPSASGEVHAVALLNQQGELILQVCGLAEQGVTESAAWRQALAGLSV
ncbi:MAG: heme ABC transporter ATP-binding protein [Chitinophagaceae bacterium]